MAYASAVVLTPTEQSAAGVDVTTLATTPTATHGNKIYNDNKTFAEVNNGSASPITVTIDVAAAVEGLAVPDRVVTIAAGKRYQIGPFKPVYNQEDGYVWLVCSAVTDVTIQAFRMP